MGNFFILFVDICELMWVSVCLVVFMVCVLGWDLSNDSIGFNFGFILCVIFFRNLFIYRYGRICGNEGFYKEILIFFIDCCVCELSFIILLN